MRIAYATLLPGFSDHEPRFIRPALAAGYLAAYAMRSRRDLDSHDIVSACDLSKRHGASKVIERILSSDPDVVALTTYVWNRESVRTVVQQIRAASKSVRIVLGGPEVSFTACESRGDFEADWICTGEGEIPFANLLNRLCQSSRFDDSIPGLIRCGSKSVFNSPGELVQNLDDIPSPYSLGLIPINPGGWLDLETHRGCPFSCRFCLYGKGFEQIRGFSVSRVISDIDFAMRLGARHAYIMDPTFNLPKDRCSSICRSIADVNDGRLSIYVEARAEIVDEAQANEFAAAGIQSVEVGLQSTNTDALRAMKRSLGRERFVRGCKLLRDRGIRVEIGVILGLPEDDETSVRQTIDFVCEQELGNISVYRLQILPGSDFATSSERLALKYQKAAPYWIESTPKLSANTLDKLEVELAKIVTESNQRYLQRLRANTRGCACAA